MGINEVLIPNKLANTSQSKTVAKQPTAKEIKNSEFSKLLEKKVQKSEENPIRFSLHANKRLEQRSMNIDQQEMQNLEKAFTDLSSKGGKDSLVLTNKGAYVVDVPNRLVVTAMQKNNMDKNVFTKIDGPQGSLVKSCLLLTHSS